ncbi:MAG: response regulator [Cyanobacteria bacterium P01_E01_bin.42]
MKSELDLQKLAGKMANALWSSVKNWDYFTQDAVGREVAKAADNLWGEEGSGNGRTIPITIDDEETDTNQPSSRGSSIPIEFEDEPTNGKRSPQKSSSIAIEIDEVEPNQKSASQTPSPIAIPIEIENETIAIEFPPTTPQSIAIAFDDEEDTLNGDRKPERSPSIAIDLDEDEIEKEGTYIESYPHPIATPPPQEPIVESSLDNDLEIAEEDIFTTPSFEIAFDEDEFERDRQESEKDAFAIPTLEISFDDEIETNSREYASDSPIEDSPEEVEEIISSISIDFEAEEIETDASIQDLQGLEEDEIFSFPVSISHDFSDRPEEIAEEIETDSRIAFSPEPILDPPTMENQTPADSPNPRSRPLRNPEGYEFFLTEARELLAEIEEQLFSLTPESGTSEIYSLMRATHTLKGASANVGRETIKTIAHNLEDVFRAMLAPEATFDQELESMLFEGYECLRLAISAELSTDAELDDDLLLNRAADLFARFQVKLGDCFNHQPPLPTSEELGFDLTKSIFEVGVNQRIEELQSLLSKEASQAEIATTLQEQANVFVGLGESLALPGFGAIATAILAAIDTHPNRAREIAQLALGDLENAQKLVLEGDRDRGGQPSPLLLELAGETIPEVEAGEVPLVEDSPELEPSPEVEDWLAPIPVDSTELNFEEDPFSSFDSEPEIELNLDSNTNLDLEIVEEEFPLISPTEQEELEASFEALNLQDSSEEIIEFDLGDPFDIGSDRESLTDSSTVEKFGELELSETSGEANSIELTPTDSDAIDLEEAFGTIDNIDDDFDLQIPDDMAEELDPQREVQIGSEQDFLPSDVWDIDDNNSGELLASELNLAPDRSNNEENIIEASEVEAIQQNLTDIPSREETFGAIDLQETLSNLPEESEPIFLEETPTLPTPTPQTPTPQPEITASAKPKTLRIDLEQLELFNHLIAELLINQNQLSLRDEQFQSTIQKLANWIRQHRSTLNQLRDSVNRSLLPTNGDRNGYYKQVHPLQKVLSSALEEASQISQATEDINLLAQTTTSTIEREQRLSNQLRDNLQTARTIALETLLKRFPPMVKQLSFIHKKSVDLQLQGSQVMVDKTIIDNLYDALLHLIRNAFDHGIESSDIRLQRGKSEQGTILLRAYHQGNRTIIEIQDDGEGLNVAKICQQGVKKGLISDREAREIQQLPQPESKLLDLLCSPGFSTTSRVSDLSGRGVGLDVVKTQLEQINGMLFVRSIPQKGTIFSLQIRGSLMNARLLICQAGRSVYGFVSNEIEQILLPGEKVRQLAGQKVLDWQQDGQDLTIPIYELGSLFNYSRSLSQCRGLTAGEFQHQELSPLLNTRENILPVLLLKGNEGFIALEVDRIIEEQELVIKPLSNALQAPAYIYGCSILADGRLALIIDGFSLVKRSQNKKAIATQLKPKKPRFEERPKSNNTLSTQNLGLYIPESNNIGKAPASSLPSSPLVRNTPKVKTVLVIDDSLTERQTLTLILQRSGYRVLQAQDGLEALEQVKGGEKIHVILCDIEMPRMNGLEFLSTVKQDKAVSPIPAIILTSRSRDKFQQIALELGAYAYLTKPYLEGEILTVIQEALQTV